jgi:hypothetical protein
MLSQIRPSLCSAKHQKLDLHEAYPCPICRRRGQIEPIALTEAFGCNLCQQIFVIRDGGYGLEQLATHYPQGRLWRWSGSGWQISKANREVAPRYWSVLFFLGGFLLALFFFNTSQLSASLNAILGVVALMAVVVALVVTGLVLALRR